ncbi:hypothetical protein [uncultured Eubacterium sp.]|uniref:hypothetical protein n=1 Tax=uncultured Eubacterium sp. TaxID=165185 RepID=UPI0025E40B1F|nr:hypothetical protein [uncultured Eubacterium sp.]
MFFTFCNDKSEQVSFLHTQRMHYMHNIFNKKTKNKSGEITSPDLRHNVDCRESLTFS